MADKAAPAVTAAPGAVPAHGAAQLPAVTVDAYNAELRTPEGFLGDRASNRAFKAILERWRDTLRAVDEDPFGDTPAGAVSRKQLDRMLTEGDPEEAGLVHGVIEEFSQAFAAVIRRFLKLREWRGTERIVVGGGMSGSRVGQVAIGRTGLLLKADGLEVSLVPLRHDPDEGGLLGAVQLAPPWVFQGHDGLLAVDIGGTNMRVGVVRPNLRRAADLSAADVWESELWRHADDKPKREEAMDRLGEMLDSLVRRAAKRGIALAPFVGVGCPGRIREDGAIEQGAQNLPGNWESSRFSLPARIQAVLPRIGDHATVVVLHNDAVVQGLSEVPFLQDVARWGVLTIGTGLGNVRFSNRAAPAP